MEFTTPGIGIVFVFEGNFFFCVPIFLTGVDEPATATGCIIGEGTMQFVLTNGRLFFAWTIALLLGSCTQEKTVENESEPTALKFMWIPKELGNEVFETGRNGGFAKADELSASGRYNIELTYAGPESALDVDGQSFYIGNAVAHEFDGIAISCNSTAGLEEAINEAVAAGIPVITFDSDSPGSNRFTYLGIDNEHGGAAAADILGLTMTDALRPKVVIVSGVEGAANLDARVKGFSDAVKEKFPELDLLDPVYCNDDRNEAATLIEGLLADNPDIGGFFFAGLWPLFVCEGTDCSENMPLWNAAATAGRVKTVSFDTLAFELPFVEKGMISGLIGQKYWGWGFDAVQMLFDHIVNEKSFSDWTDSGLDVVCANNVDEMVAAWETADFTTPLPPCKIDDVTVE